MQLLYRWCLTGEAIEGIIGEFCASENYQNLDRKHFERLVYGCIEHQKEAEKIVYQIINYPLTDVDAIEQVIIRSAIYEMVFFKETDRAVVISEAVALAKKFGATEGYRFVNGVLDQVKDLNIADE